MQKNSTDSYEDIDDVKLLASSTEAGQHGMDETIKKGQHAPPIGETWAVFFYFVVSVVLLMLLPVATGRAPSRFDWYAEPWLAPAFALGVCSTALGIKLIFDIRKKNFIARLWYAFVYEFFAFISAIKLSILFALYVIGILYVGYLLSTLIFTIWCLWHTKLQRLQYTLVAIGFTIGVILFFRVGLGIWLPTPEWYNNLPEVLIPIFTQYF